MKTKNRNIIAAFLFLTAFIFFYPALFIKIPSIVLTIILFSFTPALLALLAIILIVFIYQEKVLALLLNNKSFFLPMSVIFAIATVHFFIIPEYTFESYMFSLAYIVIPLFILLNKSAFLRYMPWFIILLWLLNTYFSGISFFCNEEYSGIARNRNWNACFILTSTPFVMFFIYKALTQYKVRKILIYLVLLCPLSISLYGLYYCYSRAANITLLLLLFLTIFLHMKPQAQKITVYCGIIAISAITYLFYIKGTDSFASLIANDVRVPLWEGTINLIKDKWAMGVGAELFESEFSTYCPVEYHLRPDAAVRNDHPHNHLLFIASTFGIFGLIAWCFLLFYPVLRFALNFDREKNPLMKIYFFAFLAIIIHGMLDMVMYRWPTNIMALMFLGLLWSRIWQSPRYEIADTPNKLTTIVRAAVLFILSVSLIFFLVQNIIYSSHLRYGMYYSHEKIEDFDKAAGELQKAINTKKESVAIYKAGMNSFFMLGNPDLTLKYLKLIKEQPGKRFAHTDGFISNILCSKGHFREALPYLRQELIHYPLSISSWNNIIRLYSILGMKKEAEQAVERMNLCLYYKGLTPKMLPLILENPDFDDHPYKIPEELRKKYEQ